MKNWLMLTSACGCLLLASCSRPAGKNELAPPIIITPAPMTPHPAPGAQARAVKLYPSLAVKGSPLNQTFLDLVEDYKITSPALLAKVDWPLAVASQAARILRIAPVPDDMPPPSATPRINPLERGAYNQQRSVNGTSTYRYYYDSSR